MYSYAKERPYVLTDEGQRQLLKMRDWVKRMLETAGAFTMGKALNVVSTGNSFEAVALLDRLVELGEVVELPGQTSASQHRVYVAARGRSGW